VAGSARLPFSHTSYNAIVKIGIVGLGFMGAVHLSAYSKIPDAEVAAVCAQGDRALSGDLSAVGGNLERDLATYDLSAAKKYRNWRELVLDPELDVIDICLPTDLHAAVSIAAMTAGKHVLCEKPMALTSSDCDRMLAAASENNRILMIGQVLRFWPEYGALHDFVRSQEYGRVLSATFIRQCGLPDWSKWLPVEARSGGAVIDLLVHDIDQALLLFGMPEKVAARQLGDGDTLSASLIYPNGPEVRVQGGWFLPGSPLVMSFQARAERAELELTPEGLMLSDESGERKKVDPPEGDGYQLEISYFLDCIRQGKQPEQCTARDSARATQLALLLKRARATGDQVKMEVP